MALYACTNRVRKGDVCGSIRYLDGHPILTNIGTVAHAPNGENSMRVLFRGRKRPVAVLSRMFILVGRKSRVAIVQPKPRTIP